MFHFMKLHSGAFSKMKSGDDTQTLRVIVKGLYPHDNFEELYKHFTPEEMGYSQENTAVVSARDMDMYYSKGEQKKYGVLAIRIERINA